MQKSTKWTLSLIITGVIVALAMAGGHWQVSYGQDTTPTVPKVTSISPQWIRAGTTQPVRVTITGDQFILYQGKGYTAVELQDTRGTPLGPSIEPDLATLTSNHLEFLVPAKYLAKPGQIEVIVRNHPSDPTANEKSEAFMLNVYVPIYMPIMMHGSVG